MLVTVASLPGATPGLLPAVDGVTVIYEAKQTRSDQREARGDDQHGTETCGT